MNDTQLGTNQPVAQAVVDAAAAATAAAAGTASADKPKIVLNFDANYVGKDVSYHFKEDKELKIKRPTVNVTIPQATPNLIVDILEKGGKQLDLLIEVINDTLYNQGRQQVNAKEDISQETLAINEINWEFIANLPPKERRGGGISKEDWADFQKDYIEVMPALTGKSLEQVTNAAKLFVARLQPVKTNKLFLNKLKEQLSIWFTKSPNAEDYPELYEFLDNKMTEFLKKDDAELLANI
jgi:hypothetical protein